MKRFKLTIINEGIILYPDHSTERIRDSGESKTYVAFTNSYKKIYAECLADLIQIGKQQGYIFDDGIGKLTKNGRFWNHMIRSSVEYKGCKIKNTHVMIIEFLD